MSERGTRGDPGLLDRDGDRLGVIGCLAVELNGYRDACKALGNRRDRSVFVNRDDIAVARLEYDLGVLREEGVEVVSEDYRLGGEHRERVVLADELTLVTVRTDIALRGIELIVCFLGVVACQNEVVGDGLVEFLESLVALAENGERKVRRLLGHGVARNDSGYAGLESDDLVTDDVGNVHIGGVILKKLAPLAAGVENGLELVGLVGREGDAFLLKVHINVLVGEGDLVGRGVERVVVGYDGQRVRVSCVLLDLLNVIGKLVDNVRGGVEIGVDRGDVLVKRLEYEFAVRIYRNVAELSAHRIVVVVDGDLCVKACLLLGAVVFGVVLNVGYRGSGEVNVEGELEGVVEVGGNAAISVVKISPELDGVLSVVLELLLVSVEADLYVCGID